VPVSLSISALVAPNSSVMVGYVIVVRDIGDHKRLENELRSLNEALERRVGERTEELEAKIEELQWLNEVMMRREERILELKEKIKGQAEDGHY
jgi:Ribonuclease G/E